MSNQKRKTQKEKQKLPSKKKAALKTKNIAIRFSDEKRERIDRAVQQEKTSITDFATDLIMEKVDRVLGDKKPHLVDVTPDPANLPKLYFRCYLDDSNRIKNDSSIFGGLVGAGITAIIFYNQLRK